MKTYICCALNALAKHVKAVGAIIAGSAIVQPLKIYGMLESAVLDERPLRYVLVVLGQAHDETEINLGIGVKLACA